MKGKVATSHEKRKTLPLRGGFDPIWRGIVRLAQGHYPKMRVF